MRFGEEVRAWLPAADLGSTVYAYDSIDSTNSQAGRLARGAAPHGTLVIADEQTAGRGRGGSHWFSPAGSAVALSVVLRPGRNPGLRLAGLGAMAVVEALEEVGLEARVKWPNDVLMRGGKVAGVLVEAAWEGERPLHCIVGIGVNVGKGSVPDPRRVDFPATSVDSIAGRRTSRMALIAAIVAAIGRGYPRLGSDGFLLDWEEHLAYRGQVVAVETETGVIEGRFLGLARDGSARLGAADGTEVVCGAEARRMRPVDRRRE